MLIIPAGVAGGKRVGTLGLYSPRLRRLRGCNRAAVRSGFANRAHADNAAVYVWAYTIRQMLSDSVVPLCLLSGCVCHRIRNQMELSFTTMAPIRRNDQTSSTPPTDRPHHEPTDCNATDQPPAKPNRRNQPPTQTDNRLNRLQIRVVARPNHLGTGHNRCFSILRHPNRMRSSASGPGFAAESVTWRLQRLQQP